MNFWSKKNVLITGASGFLGNKLFESLMRKNVRVISIVRNKKKIIINDKKLFKKTKSKIYEIKITDTKKYTRKVEE